MNRIFKMLLILLIIAILAPNIQSGGARDCHQCGLVDGKKIPCPPKNCPPGFEPPFVYGVQTGKSGTPGIYYKPANNSDKWRKLNGQLKWISSGNKNMLWGVSKNDDIYHCDKPCGKGNWVKIDGKLAVCCRNNFA